MVCQCMPIITSNLGVLDMEKILVMFEGIEQNHFLIIAFSQQDIILRSEYKL